MTVRVVNCVALLLVCGFVSALQAQTPPASPSAAKHAPLTKPRNLQVLPTETSIPDLVNVMVGFSQALGVTCLHCHATIPGVDPEWDLNFASDEKPQKQTARLMLRMVTDINGKYLVGIATSRQAGAVGCGNCHLGHVSPPAFVAPGSTVP